jgi:hypothetical protein
MASDRLTAAEAAIASAKRALAIAEELAAAGDELREQRLATTGPDADEAKRDYIRQIARAETSKLRAAITRAEAELEAGI